MPARKRGAAAAAADTALEACACPVCQTDLRTSTVSTALLRACGHTLCSECAAAIAESDAQKCPLCRKPLVGEPLRNFAMEAMLDAMPPPPAAKKRVLGAQRGLPAAPDASLSKQLRDARARFDESVAKAREKESERMKSEMRAAQVRYEELDKEVQAAKTMFEEAKVRLAGLRKARHEADVRLASSRNIAWSEHCAAGEHYCFKKPVSKRCVCERSLWLHKEIVWDASDFESALEESEEE